MEQHYDICIRGAGIVGRTLALLLAQARLRVALCGPSAMAPGNGGGDLRAYSLNAASRHLLQSVRGWPDHSTWPITAMQIFGDDRSEVNFSAKQMQTDALAWMVDVPALESHLEQAIRFQPLIKRIDRPIEEVDAIQLSAALTLVCEGRASNTRSALGIDFEVRSYTQTAIATRLTSARQHRQVARQWFGEKSILAFLPLQDYKLAVVWSVPTAQAPELLALSDAEFSQRLETASRQSLGALQLDASRAAWPLQFAQAKRWVGKTGKGITWALAGDAAHTIHPLAGQGLNLGLSDAAELARVLRERAYWRPLDDMKLLRQYERARQVDFLAVGYASDGLQQLFVHDTGMARALRNFGLNGFERSGVLKKWVANRAMGL